MADQLSSTDQLRAHKHFMEEVEMAIRAANREIIGKHNPGLDRDRFFRLAVSVARVRAEYLVAALAMNWEGEPPDIRNLEAKRAVYEEAVKAFEALERMYCSDLSGHEGK